MNCTVATEQIRGLFELDLSQLDAVAEAAKAGSDGVVVLPFFSGERAPNLPRARASIMGLTMSNGSRGKHCPGLHGSGHIRHASRP